MHIHPVIAENWKMDGGAAFGVVPQTIWTKLIEPDEKNMIPITTRCLLVEENDRKILLMWEWATNKRINITVFGILLEVSALKNLWQKLV
ncbi:MAG: hypothetical protein R2759_07225 [Bacteroidales bacterium]